MKKLLLRPSRFGLIVLFALSVAAQTAPTEKSKTASASAKFELSWARPNTPTVQAVRAKLQMFEQRQQTGMISGEEVAQIRYELEDLERRTPYSLTIQSRGGSLKEFMTAMSASEEVSFTLINAGDPADLETQLPAFNLRNANWGTVIEVLANFLATRGLQLRHAGGDSPNPSDARSVVCVLRRIDTPKVETRIEPTAFESFPLALYLSEQSVDDIVGAIRAGWELDPSHDRDALRLKFHPATSILLVSGPPMATNIAGKIISQLKRPAPKIVKTPPQETPPPEAKKQ